MELGKLLHDVQIAAVVCNQFGDTGKGKICDVIASEWADVTARGTGGNNAGHTVVVNGKERIFHLIPAGIVNDSRGQISILGNGMVDDLEVLCGELDDLDREDLSYDNLMISRDAHVVMPYQIERDRARNQSQKAGGVGSTGRGIGPCYADKIARRGVRIRDLFDRDVLVRKIVKAAEFYPEQNVDVDNIIGHLVPHIARIKPFVRDTVAEMHRFVREGKRILLEGAQGLLLSIEHGTYPYVTSSDCSLNGTASGVGLSARAVDLPLGIVKFPLMTRVGAGPFPTEFGGRVSEMYCAEGDGNTWRKEKELKFYEIPHTRDERGVHYDPSDPAILRMINSDDEFRKGVGIRLAAGEYGATTARPRRIGWTDAVIGRYAVAHNGPKMVLTKADCLAGAESFNLCYGYDTGVGATEQFDRSDEFLRGVNPLCKSYEGYGDISEARNYGDLPQGLREAIDDFERFTDGEVVVVSVGADREDTIVR